MRPAQRGFTYLTALFIVAILAGGLARTGEVWDTSARREKEVELLFVGNQYRQAIARYYLSGPQRRHPPSLEDLLKDPRMPGTQRHLRRLYPDPLTGSNEWGLVRAPDGGIAGVHSLSTARPLKAAGFKLRDAEFEGAASYADWKFTHAPQAAQPAAPKPAAKSQAKSSAR